MSYLGLIEGFLTLALLKNDILLFEGKTIFGSLKISTLIPETILWYDIKQLKSF